MNKGREQESPEEGRPKREEPQATVESTAAQDIEIDEVVALGARGDFTDLVITGDHFGKDLEVAAGDRLLDAEVVSPNELHVALPSDVVELDGVHLSIRSGFGEIGYGVRTELFVLSSGLGAVDRPGAAPQGSIDAGGRSVPLGGSIQGGAADRLDSGPRAGLAGDGDTEF